MSYYADLIDKLAIDVLQAAEDIGDERLPETIAQVIGASSPTTEELFRTAVRIRLAETRARKVLAEKLSGHKRTAALAAAAAQAAQAKDPAKDPAKDQPAPPDA